MITTQKYKEISDKYQQNKVRFLSRYIGESVFDSAPNGLDTDYYEIVITNIDTDEMYIEGLDKSQNNKLVRLSYFTTKDELLSMGYILK